MTKLHSFTAFFIEEACWRRGRTHTAAASAEARMAGRGRDHAPTEGNDGATGRACETIGTSWHTQELCTVEHKIPRIGDL